MLNDVQKDPSFFHQVGNQLGRWQGLDPVDSNIDGRTTPALLVVGGRILGHGECRCQASLATIPLCDALAVDNLLALIKRDLVGQILDLVGLVEDDAAVKGFLERSHNCCSCCCFPFSGAPFWSTRR